MSMRTTWTDGKVPKAVTAPVSLIVSAFAPLADARRVLTPELARDAGPSVLLWVSLAGERHRLGASALAQVYGQIGDAAPDGDHPQRLRAFFEAIQELHGTNRLLAYHDISDGGLFVTLVEMAFASRIGMDVTLPSAGGAATRPVRRTPLLITSVMMLLSEEATASSWSILS
jgi:phosphoribosylformylglycinamidine synthase